MKSLVLVLDYAASRYEKESTEKYQSIFLQIAQFLAKNVSQKEVSVKEIKQLFIEKKKHSLLDYLENSAFLQTYCEISLSFASFFF